MVELVVGSTRMDTTFEVKIQLKTMEVTAYSVVKESEVGGQMFWNDIHCAVIGKAISGFPHVAISAECSEVRELVRSARGNRDHVVDFERNISARAPAHAATIIVARKHLDTKLLTQSATRHDR
jgi:hypothetical protein